MTRITKQYYSYYVMGLQLAEKDQSENDDFIWEKLYNSEYFMKELLPVEQEEAAFKLQELQIQCFEHRPINNHNVEIGFFYINQ